MKKKTKDTIAVSSAIFMLLFGCGLTTVGFIMPPEGEISGSVLWVLGQSLIYVASIFGVSMYVKSEINEAKAELMGKQK